MIRYRLLLFVFVNCASFLGTVFPSDNSVTWTRVIQAPDKEIVFRARPAKDGGSIVTGEVRSHGNVDGLVLKIAGDGTIEWQKRFDAGRPRVFVQGSGGSFLGAIATVMGWKSFLLKMPTRI